MRQSSQYRYRDYLALKKCYRGENKWFFYCVGKQAPECMDKNQSNSTILFNSLKKKNVCYTCREETDLLLRCGLNSMINVMSWSLWVAITLVNLLAIFYSNLTFAALNVIMINQYYWWFLSLTVSSNVCWQDLVNNTAFILLKVLC